MICFCSLLRRNSLIREFLHERKRHHKICSVLKQTRLLVSGRSPECFDCLLRSMKQKYDEKIKYKKKKKKEFEIFCENHPPTRHIKYKVISLASSNK